MTDALMLALDGSRDGCLHRVTLAAPPGLDVDELAAPLSTGLLGAWLVRCRSLSTGADHLHGLALNRSAGDVSRILADVVAAHDLDPAAADVQRVRGWRSHASGRSSAALRRSVHFIARYDLGLGEHRSKRARELPLGVTASGAFTGCDAPARPALDVTPEGYTPATVTCGCGCRAPVPLGRRLYASARCSARARQRRRRARLASRSDDIPLRRDMTAATQGSTSDVTPNANTAPTVTSEVDRAELLRRAAREAVDIEGNDAPPEVLRSSMRAAHPQLAEVSDRKLERALMGTMVQAL